NDSFRLDEQLGSLVHAFYQQQAQINGGKMNRFAAASDAQGYAMAYWDITGLRLWDYARRYTLADNFFHAAFGGSFLNHFWLVCACTPVYPNAPDKIVAKLDGAGKLVKDGAVTPTAMASTPWSRSAVRTARRPTRPSSCPYRPCPRSATG